MSVRVKVSPLARRVDEKSSTPHRRQHFDSTRKFVERR
jgi:hypothetical protein